MAFKGLNVNISGDSGSAVASLNAVAQSLGRTDRSADSAADSMEEFGDDVSQTTAKVTALGGAAAGTSGSLTALGSTNVGSSLTSMASSAAILGTALGGITAAAVPLVTTLGGLATAATGLATGFGAVVGSGLLAFGQERGEQNEERLEQVNERITELETLREETGDLTEAQQDQLDTLEDQADELEGQTGIVGGLTSAFSELGDELRPLILDLGEEFTPLIADAFEAIPTLVERIIDSLGPLDDFKDALRDAGEQAMDSIPAAVETLMDLGRESLPAVRDLGEYLVDNAQPAFEEMMETTDEVAPILEDMTEGFIDALPALNDVGTAILDTVIPALGQTADSIGEFLESAEEFADQHQIPEFAETATEAIEDLATTVTDSEIFGSLASTVRSDLGAVSDAIGQAADGRFDRALGTLVTRAENRIGEITTLLAGEGGEGGVIRGATEDLAAWFEGGGQQRIGEGFGELTGSIESAATDVRNGLIGPDGEGGIFNALVDGIATTAETADFSDAFTSLETAVTDAHDAIQNTLIGPDGEGGVVDVVTGAVEGAQDYINSDGTGILASAGEAAGDILVSGFQTQLNTLIGPEGRSGILTDIAGLVETYLRDTFPGLMGDAFEAIGTIIRESLKDIIVAPLQGKDSVFWGSLKSAVNWIVENGPGLITSIPEMILDTITESITGLYDGLVGNSVLKDAIWDAVDWVVENGPDKVLEIPTAIVDGILDGITGAAEGYVALQEQLWSKIGDQLDKLVDGEFGDLIPESLTNIGSDVVGKIGEGISGAADTLASAINGVLPDTIPLPDLDEGDMGSFEVSAFGQSVGIDLPPSDINLGSIPIPNLAEGGVVTGDTLARIGEGRSDEAVIPLDQDDRVGAGTSIEIGNLTIHADSDTNGRDVARDFRRELEGFDV